MANGMKKGRQITVTYYVPGCATVAKNFTDWWDFADWIKQENLSDKVICIIQWMYTDVKVPHG